MRRKRYTMEQYLQRHQQIDIAKAVGVHHSRLSRARYGVTPCEYVFEECRGEVVMMQVIGRGPVPPRAGKERK